MKTFAHDVEIFQDFFSIVLINVYDTNEIYSWCTSSNSVEGNMDGIAELFEKVQSEGPVTYVGYNSLQFDEPVIHAIIQTGSIRKTKEVADACATNSNRRTDVQKELIKRYRKRSRTSPFQSNMHLDLMLIFNKVDRVSLKRMSVSMHSETVEDLPIPPDGLAANERERVLSYNTKDVMRTVELFHKLYDEIILRYNISREYGVDVYSASRSVMGARLMEKMYLEMNPNISPWDLREMGTPRSEIHFGRIISPKVRFSSPGLKHFLEEMEDISFRRDDGEDLTQRDIKFGKRVLIGKTTYQVGLGGLHSEHIPEYIYSKGQDIIDADVASYYPRIMINEKVYPQHLGEGFLDLFDRIVRQRLAAKKAGIKTTADALKITINSVFGKMGGRFEWFYDLEALYRVTINGQLFLLMLIERLNDVGIDVFYANTDGITCILKDDKDHGNFDQICLEWQQELGFELEFTNIDQMMIRDVNNYTLKTKDGKVKEKGEFIREPQLGKKVDAQIVPIAIHEWFYNGVPIADTVRSQKDIKPFIMTGKVGEQFEAVFHTIEKDHTGNPSKVEIPLQRTNRYYAATGSCSGTILKKRKSDGNYENMLKKSQVFVCNDWTKPLLAPINYDYYINRALKTIETFNTQQTLF